MHAVTKILAELRAIFGDGDNLVAKMADVVNVSFRDFTTHTDLGSSFDRGFEILGQNVSEGCFGGV